MNNETLELIKSLVRENDKKDKYIDKLHLDLAELHREILRKEEVIQKYEETTSADTLAE